MRWRAHKVDVGRLWVWVVLRVRWRDEKRRDVVVAAWVWESVTAVRQGLSEFVRLC